MENRGSKLRQELFNQGYHLKEMGLTFEEVSTALRKYSNDDALLDGIIKEVRETYYKTKRKEGLTKIGVGVILILSGFLITCFNFHTNQSFNFAMYGLTSVGICFVFWGLYKILG